MRIPPFLRERKFLLSILAGILSLLILAGAGWVLREKIPFMEALFHGGTDVNELLPVSLEEVAAVPVSAERILLRAEAAFSEGEIREAMNLLERAIAQGADVIVLKKLFEAALLLGDQKKAESVLGLLQFQGVPESDLEALRGLLLLRTGALSDAKAIFEQQQDWSNHRFGLLLVAILEGDYAGVTEHAAIVQQSPDPFLADAAKTIQGAQDEFALFEDGKETHRKTLLARALGQMHEWPAAIRLLREVTAAEPGYRDAHILLGYSLLMIDNPTEALSAFEAAYAIDPEKAETQYFLGRAHERLGETIEAETFYGYALQNGFAPATSVRTRLASLALARGASEEALREYEAIVAAGEADGVTYRRLITLVLDQQHDTERARSIALQAKEKLGENSSDTLDLVGWTALLAGDLDTAAFHLRASVEQDPTLAPAWYHKGLLEEQVGEREQALASYRRAYEEAIGLDMETATMAAEKHNALLAAGEKN